MSVTIEWDFSEFEKSLKALQKKLKPDSDAIRRSLFFTAEWILGLAQSKVPVNEGSLGASATTQEIKGGVEFGFDKVYAAAQDLGFPNMRVRPRRKKWLYVPISDKGRRYHSYGRDPATEGLVYNVDYVLKKSVDIPNKPYGHKRGPNKYFSETLKNNKEKIYEVLVQRLKKEVGFEE